MLVLFGGKNENNHKIFMTIIYTYFSLYYKGNIFFNIYILQLLKIKNKLNLFLSSFTFYIFLGHRSMRTATNYFLLNLSIADLLMSSLNCMFNFIFMLNSDWPFGTIYCTINNFMANVTVSTSVFTLVAISFDR